MLSLGVVQEWVLRDVCGAQSNRYSQAKYCRSPIDKVEQILDMI